MELKYDKKADEAVRKFCNEIVDLANQINPGADIEFSLELASSNTDTYSAEAAITSHFGVVMVLPDFVNSSSKACIVKYGLIKALRKEGFTEDQIWKEHPIFGDTLDHTPKSVATLADFLTRKIDATKS